MATISHRPMRYTDALTPLRDADAAECWAMGASPRVALIESLRGSLQAFAVLEDEVPLAFWGYSGGWVGDTVYGWLLTCPAIEGHKFRLARSSRRVVEWLLRSYNRIVIVVHEDHLLSIKWLTWLGFHPISPGPIIYMAKEK